MTEKEMDEFQRLLELAWDLRCYTHDWDWKYGEEWDRELNRFEGFLEKEKERGDGTQRLGSD